MKFRKSFCTTGARKLDFSYTSLHSPIKLDSITHFHTFNHVMAILKHLRSKKKLFEKAREDMERKGGTIPSNVHAQRGLKYRNAV